MSINKEHMTGKNQKEENNTVEKQKDNKVLNSSENFHKLKKKHSHALISRINYVKL